MIRNYDTMRRLYGQVPGGGYAAAGTDTLLATGNNGDVVQLTFDAAGLNWRP